jgi:hypothetical protein
MIPGISFNELHSFKDFNLVLARAEIPPAAPKTTYIDIPGGNGSIDLTEALGEVKYKDREAEFIFIVFPDDNFEGKKQEVNERLNGVNCKITLDADPEYFYQGRCAVNNYDNARNRIAVSARLKPYKLAQKETKRVFDLSAIPKTVKLINDRMAVCPYIECSDRVTVEFNGQSFDFEAGVHKELDIRLVKGENFLTISGSGKITFTYREGAL